MKHFFKKLLKFAIAVSSITAAAILVYRFFKKHVTIEHGKTTVSGTDHAEKTDNAETDGEAKPVNRKYVNIVLDWDQPEDAPSKEEQKQETAPDDAGQPQDLTGEENSDAPTQEDSNAPTQEDSNAPAQEDSNAPAQEGSDAPAQEAEKEETIDSSIHLD